ncbi:CHAD domain-containing protein [Amycolatopsis mongoliensis]|uniref:CHAD domain-containing protein n=1 Tax=Amycolatopsis mongoliensis TaxID=715475 RepID=A0A9Y2JN85_9PSEU|nr:CHAD domain-containing protein [Amycolatopsis sp. 4-36]WIY00444.1 CHAD domain-containing protein [Amycolatopsis sp. 4-36]
MTTTIADTVFFDTDGLRLLRNGLALSVRSGRWRLDTPDGPVCHSGSESSVPPALSGLVRAYTRDDELVPVANLDGGGVAELRAALGSRIAAPPRPPDGSARAVVLAYVRAQLAALAAADLAVRQGRPDAVHRMRVAARRLRGVFSAYAKVLGGRKLLREVSGALRWLGGELAPARDTEVQWARSRPWADEPSDAYFAALAEEAETRALRALDSRRYVQLLNALDVLELVLSEEPRYRWGKAARRPAAKVLPRLAHVVAAEVDGRVARVAALPAGPDRDRAVHDVRKAAKRLRYALEAAGAKVALHEFQDLLGEFQDAVVAQAHLRELGVREGPVHDGEAAAAAHCAEALPGAWHALRKDLRPLWT